MNDLETRKHGASRSSERQTSGYSAAALTPAVDVVEDGSAITLCADLPGGVQGQAANPNRIKHAHD